MKRLIVVALLACGSSPPQGPGAPGGGSASSAEPRTPCDAVRARVEQLYRSGARDRAPARIAELVADNTAMVMNDCRKAPDKTTACITAATSAAELETRCLIALDDEGSEGDRR